MLHFLFDLTDDIMGYGLMKHHIISTASYVPVHILIRALGTQVRSDYSHYGKRVKPKESFGKVVLRQYDALGRLLVDERRWGACQHWGL
jgi:hypothetical protein